jgi:mannose/cellobiose epimerase-like protein (N-acyl-D-glucosamine 2-epimerase family)
MNQVELLIADLKAKAREWLFVQALPLWFNRGIDKDNWGFAERLDQNGDAILEPRRINVQARQTYVFTLAQQLGWRADRSEQLTHAELVDHGLAAIERYRRHDKMFAFKLNVDGTVFDNRAELYGQAFVLFAWAQVAKEPSRFTSLHVKADEFLALLRSQRGHEIAGFDEDRPRTMPLRSNPHMHLFEAAQAWMQVSSDKIWLDLANEIAALAISKFIDKRSGWLCEHFDENWCPMADVQGILAEPGHQFEWAWLLERFARTTGQAEFSAHARQLYVLGLSAIDETRKVPFFEYTLNQGPRVGSTRLWPTTEWLKAAMIFDDVEQVREAYAGLCLFLQTPIKGLWGDKMTSDGQIVNEPTPASTFYHIICAFAELFDYQAGHSSSSSLAR